MTEEFKRKLKFDAAGLIPAVIQDAASGRVLTLCYMNAEALDKTLSDGHVWVYRRSAGKLMKKGETSGHTQKVKTLRADCEGKSLLIEIEQKVAACHAGYFSCYFESYEPARGWKITDERVFRPESVYPGGGSKSPKP